MLHVDATKLASVLSVHKTQTYRYIFNKVDTCRRRSDGVCRLMKHFGEKESKVTLETSCFCSAESRGDSHIFIYLFPHLAFTECQEGVVDAPVAALNNRSSTTGKIQGFPFDSGLLTPFFSTPSPSHRFSIQFLHVIWDSILLVGLILWLNLPLLQDAVNEKMWAEEIKMETCDAGWRCASWLQKLNTFKFEFGKRERRKRKWKTIM